MEVAPDVYEVVAGFNPMDGCVVPAGAEDAARRGADACPEGAISLEHEEHSRPTGSLDGRLA